MLPKQVANYRLLKPPLPSNESASHFLAVYMGPSLLFTGGRVYTCKPCFVKLEKGCKKIHAIQHCCKQPLSLLHVPVMVKTVFPDVKKAVVLIPNGFCMIRTIGPHWSRILSVSALNILAGSTAFLTLSLSLSLSLSVGKSAFSPQQSTATSNGGGAGPHHLICALSLSSFLVGMVAYASLRGTKY